MKQFLTVLRFEMNNYFKNKSFLLTTGILMAIIAGVILIPTMIPGFLQKGETSSTVEENMEETLEGEKECLGIYIAKDIPEDLHGFLQSFPVVWKIYQEEESLKKDVKNESISAGFLLQGKSEYTYVVKNKTMGDEWNHFFANALTQWKKTAYLMEKGLSQDEITEAESITVCGKEEVLGKDGVKSYWYTYILIMVIYFMIIFYGQMIAVSVTNEKSNRAIEILVTSVNSNSLIFGKVLAGAIAGMVQMMLILGVGFICYGSVRDVWGGMLDVIFDIPTEVLIVYFVFQLCSYLLYSFIFGAIGAMVSKTEDISKSATPMVMLYMVSFFIAIFGMNVSDSMMMKIASFVPFTSGNAMFIRTAMGSVNLWEILLSLGILIATCIFVGILAAKIFRVGTLHYGNPVKWRKILQVIRKEKKKE